MTTPYRNDVDALRERKASLEQEIAQLKSQTRELDGLRSREAELERELAAIADKLGGNKRRALPMLDQVSVASPCNASWDEMIGDERVRFCLGCEKSVYNLSAMEREDAERLLQERVGAELCVRFYQRADGTIMTADCPVGVKRKRRKKLAIAVAGAGAMAFAAMSAFEKSTCSTPVMGELAAAPTDPGAETMGKVASAPAAPAAPPAPSASEEASPPPKPEPPPVRVMGLRKP